MSYDVFLIRRWASYRQSNGIFAFDLSGLVKRRTRTNVILKFLNKIQFFNFHCYQKEICHGDFLKMQTEIKILFIELKKKKKKRTNKNISKRFSTKSYGRNKTHLTGTSWSFRSQGDWKKKKNLELPNRFCTQHRVFAPLARSVGDPRISYSPYSSRNDLIKLETFHHAALTRYVTSQESLLRLWLSPSPLSNFQPWSI